MIAAARLVGGPVRNPAQLSPVVSAKTPIIDADLAACLEVVRESFARREADTGDGPDKIAKGPDFIGFLLEPAVAATDETL